MARAGSHRPLLAAAGTPAVSPLLGCSLVALPRRTSGEPRVRAAKQAGPPEQRRPAARGSSERPVWTHTPPSRSRSVRAPCDLDKGGFPHPCRYTGQAGPDAALAEGIRPRGDQGRLVVVGPPTGHADSRAVPAGRAGTGLAVDSSGLPPPGCAGRGSPFSAQVRNLAGIAYWVDRHHRVYEHTFDSASPPRSGHPDIVLRRDDFGRSCARSPSIRARLRFRFGGVRSPGRRGAWPRRLQEERFLTIRPPPVAAVAGAGRDRARCVEIANMPSNPVRLQPTAKPDCSLLGADPMNARHAAKLKLARGP